MKSLLLALVLVLLAAPARAQHLDATVDFGRTYDLIEGCYVPAMMTGLTLSFEQFSVNSTTYWHTNGRPFQHDLSLDFERPVRRVTVTGSIGYYRWRLGVQDWLAGAGLKVRIF